MGWSRLAIAKKFHVQRKTVAKVYMYSVRSSPDYNYAQKGVVDMYMYVTCGRAFCVVQRCMG